MENPHQIPPATRLQRVFEVLAAIGVIGCVVPLAIWWNDLPHFVPVHFGLNGQPDHIGGKGTFVVVAVVATVLYAAMTVVARFPRLMNHPPDADPATVQTYYAAGRTMMAGNKAFMTLLLAWTLWGGIQTALGRANGLGPWVMIVVAAYLVLVVGFAIVWSRRLKKLPPVPQR